MSIHLSNRLTACLKAVSPYQTLADVGTDHGYLPCVGVLEQKITSAIAADIGEGPLNAAKQQINRYELNDQIQARLGAGVSVLNPGEVEVVVIAGMGGKLITSILSDNMTLTRSFKRLVLQPNIDADILRTCLHKNQIHIIDETIIYEDDKFYEIIVAEPRDTTQELSSLDLGFGPFLRQEKCAEFKMKWQKKVDKNNEILKKIPSTYPRAIEISKQQAVLKEVLS